MQSTCYVASDIQVATDIDVAELVGLEKSGRVVRILVQEPSPPAVLSSDQNAGVCSRAGGHPTGVTGFHENTDESIGRGAAHIAGDV